MSRPCMWCNNSGGRTNSRLEWEKCLVCNGTGWTTDDEPDEPSPEQVQTALAAEPKSEFVLNRKRPPLPGNAVILTDENGAVKVALSRRPDLAMRGFLAAAITAHAAGDTTALHALADWLAERGHPDSELVRAVAQDPA